MTILTSNSLVLKIVIDANERQQAIDLLNQQQLPVSDIDDNKLLYVLMIGQKIIGTGGLEIFEDCGVLRNVSVINEEQKKGYGKFITDAIEKYVKEAGIDCLYLLTTTAKDFFGRQGYCLIKREDAPGAVQQTAQFTSLCPSTAVVMKKRL